MALLVAMVGLLGTVVVQQVAFRATIQGNEAIVAMRLGTQRMEQFSAATTAAGPPVVDELAARAAETGTATVWSTPEYLDASGACSGGTTTWTARCRWRREWQVINTGVGRPYDISVRVTYDMEGSPKVVRFDAERRKTF